MCTYDLDFELSDTVCYWYMYKRHCDWYSPLECFFRCCSKVNVSLKKKSHLMKHIVCIQKRLDLRRINPHTKSRYFTKPVSHFVMQCLTSDSSCIQLYWTETKSAGVLLSLSWVGKLCSLTETFHYLVLQKVFLLSVPNHSTALPQMGCQGRIRNNQQ